MNSEPNSIFKKCRYKVTRIPTVPWTQPIMFCCGRAAPHRHSFDTWRASFGQTSASASGNAAGQFNRGYLGYDTGRRSEQIAGVRFAVTCSSSDQTDASALPVLEGHDINGLILHHKAQPFASPGAANRNVTQPGLLEYLRTSARSESGIDQSFAGDELVASNEIRNCPRCGWSLGGSCGRNNRHDVTAWN